MRHTFRQCLNLACGLLVLASAQADQAQEDKFYLKGDLGAAWTMETSFTDFSPHTGVHTGEVTFDTGARFGAVGGCKLTDWFAAEAELGMYASPIQSAQSLYGKGSGTLFNLPFLANVRFQYRNRSRFTPYVGGGAGGSLALLHADQFVFGRVLEGFTAFRSVEGTECTLVFAYQAFAGVAYALNKNMTVGLEYHFFGTREPVWEGFQIGFGSAQIQSVSASFSYRF